MKPDTGGSNKVIVWTNWSWLVYVKQLFLTCTQLPVPSARLWVRLSCSSPILIKLKIFRYYYINHPKSYDYIHSIIIIFYQHVYYSACIIYHKMLNIGTPKYHFCHCPRSGTPWFYIALMCPKMQVDWETGDLKSSLTSLRLLICPNTYSRIFIVCTQISVSDGYHPTDPFIAINTISDSFYARGCLCATMVDSSLLQRDSALLQGTLKTRCELGIMLQLVQHLTLFLK